MVCSSVNSQKASNNLRLCNHETLQINSIGLANVSQTNGLLAHETLQLAKPYSLKALGTTGLLIY